MGKQKNGEDQSALLNVNETPVSKGLAYTKKDYEDIVVDTKKLIDMYEQQDTQDEKLRDLYGIYYAGVAGLLRSGAICRRITGRDGFPEIAVMAHAVEYYCPEVALREILKESADDIVHPYEDTFMSYVDPLSYSGASVSNKQEPVQKNENDLISRTEMNKQISDTQRKYKDSVDKLKKDYEKKLKELSSNANSNNADSAEIVALKQEIEAQKDKCCTLSEKLDATEEVKRKYKALYESKNSVKDTQLAELQQREKELKKKLLQIQNQADRFSNAYMDLQKEANQEKENRRHFTYNPNYDQYYSDMLPKIIDSLEYSHSDYILKVVCALLCCGGILMSLLFII